MISLLPPKTFKDPTNIDAKSPEFDPAIDVNFPYQDGF